MDISLFSLFQTAIVIVCVVIGNTFFFLMVFGFFALTKKSIPSLPTFPSLVSPIDKEDLSPPHLAAPASSPSHLKVGTLKRPSAQDLAERANPSLKGEMEAMRQTLDDIL